MNERIDMNKIVTIFVLTVFLTGSTPLFAAETKKADSPAAAGQSKKTVFNNLSNFLSGFDRPFKRPGNKQPFFTATADWLKNIDKY